MGDRARTSDKQFQSRENRRFGIRIKRGENPGQRLDLVGLAAKPQSDGARNLEDPVNRFLHCRHGV